MNPVQSISIGTKNIGPDDPCFIIAEAGVNHNGNLDLATKLVDVAVKAGADAVKFQTFKAERLVSSIAPLADYQRAATKANESQLDLLRQLELSYNDHRFLQDYCQEKKMVFLSSPFDIESADFLNDLDVPAFKVGSGEITNIPLLKHIAQFRKPIILSTGMSYLSEVDEAVRIIRQTENNQLVVLHCVSNYPADSADVNLRAMQTMFSAFQLPVGYSDHTLGTEVSLAAVALGADIIEKHFTLDHDLPGPDHQASLIPAELSALIKGIRMVEAALGHGRKVPVPSETNTAAVARKSLVASQDIYPGDKLTPDHIAIKRPGTGLPPTMYSCLIGRTVQIFISKDELITLEMLA